VSAIEWIAAAFLSAGLAGTYLVERGYRRLRRTPDPEPRDRLRTLDEERVKQIARAMTEGRAVEDPDDARLALEAYGRARQWNDLFWRLVVAGLLTEIGGLLFVIHWRILFPFIILGVGVAVELVVGGRMWRRRRRGDRWAAATRARHSL
jgi:hypothetical protein